MSAVSSLTAAVCAINACTVSLLAADKSLVLPDWVVAIFSFAFLVGLVILPIRVIWRACK